MGDLIRAERMQMNMRSYLVHPRDQIAVCVNSKFGMHPTQWTDLSNTPCESETYLCLNCCLIIAVCPFITHTPAKAAEAAEVLTDIGHMQILIFHIGDNITHMALSHLICRRRNLENFPAPCAQKPGCFCLSKVMSTEYI